MSVLFEIKVTVIIFFGLFLAKVIWGKLKQYCLNDPFKVTRVFSPQLVEMDRKERKKVLKRAFSLKRIPAELDAIIVGSGIGGLSCAGLMARSGKRVLILEQHGRVGGCTHTYKSKGCEYDIGIHYIGNMEHGSMNRCLIDFLTDGQLEWEELDEHFDTVVINKSVTDTSANNEVQKFPCLKGMKRFQEQLINFFPEEKATIVKFMQLLKSCKSVSTLFVISKILPKWLLKAFFHLGLLNIFFPNYSYLTQTSVKEVLDELTDNKDLKAVLSYCWGDYGAFPSQSCFLMHGMLLNHMIRTGGYYPKGGASEIAFQIIPGILRSGGEILTNVKVEEIMVENGKACGVKVRGNYLNSTMHELKAPVIISAAGIYNTYNAMLTKQLREEHKVFKGLDCIEPGISCLQIMVGLEGTKKELELPAKNFWIFSSNDPETDGTKYLSLSRGEAANITTGMPVLFVSFPSAKDSTWNDRFPGKSTCVIVTFSSLAWFEEWKDLDVKKRGPVYQNFKNSFTNQAWEQVLGLFPHLKDKVINIESGTPLSHIHYLNSMHGEIYGAHHNKQRFSFNQAMNLRPETSIPGLFLTGQDIFTCGFIGGAFAGLLTASTVLNRYLMLDLINQVKRVRSSKKCL